MGPPVYQKTHRFRPGVLKKIVAEFKKRKEVGIVRDSKFQWASPIIIIDGERKQKMRVAGDFCILNTKTMPDRYPLPNLKDSTQQLYEKKFLTFHNILIYFSDIDKTALISPARFYGY